MSIYILAIESSCDDTSASVIKDGRPLSNFIANQSVHEKYGGVVPELASRAHQQNIIPVVEAALAEAKITKEDLDAIAVTIGPGLLGSLIVGVSFAKSFALTLNIPLIGVHHMHAHILAHFAENPHPPFPFLCLTVSGGHTQIVKIQAYNKMKVIGTTIDDAAGEAFDKAGKMMGLPYPAGPHIDKNAKNGIAKFTFSKSKVEGLDFSFSGLKTSILYFLRDQVKKDPQFINDNMNDLCASVQQSIIDMLLIKLAKAAEQTGITEIAIAGGVSANSGLRAALQDHAIEKNWNVYIPRFEYCTDNAAMIGVAGYYKFLDKIFIEADATADPRAPF